MPLVATRDPLNIDESKGFAGRSLAPKLTLYDAIIDLMLSEPGISLKEIGARIGRSPAFMTYTVHTDHFRDLLRRRREAKNAAIDAELTMHLKEVAVKAVKVLDKKLTNDAAINPIQAKEIADTVLQRLGYGVKTNNDAQVAIQTNVITLSPEDFSHAQNVVRTVEGSIGLSSPRKGATKASESEIEAPEVDSMLPTLSYLKKNIQAATEEDLDSILARVDLNNIIEPGIVDD